MTLTRPARVLAAVLLALVAATALSFALDHPRHQAPQDAPTATDALPGDSDPTPAPEAPQQAQDGADAALLAALNAAGVYAPTADAALTSAHLVCEGVTAGVPAATMAATLAGQYGWSPAQAASFVDAARTIFCVPSGS